MEVAQIEIPQIVTPFFRLSKSSTSCGSHDKFNFLQCQCENYQNKCYSVCDICSENKFLRESSETSVCDTDSSSFSDEVIN